MHLGCKRHKTMSVQKIIAKNEAGRQESKGYTHMEGKRMVREDHRLAYCRREFAKMERLLQLKEQEDAKKDRVDALQEAVDALTAETRELRALQGRSQAVRAKPVFSTGQSVLQWWASWFKDSKSAPGQYKAKQRPSWFSGEVASPGVFVEDKMYAGMSFTGWMYSTH